VRVIYYFHSEAMPLYLLTVFGKNEKADLSGAERNELAHWSGAQGRHGEEMTKMAFASIKRGLEQAIRHGTAGAFPD